MKYLHTMVRVRDLDRALEFFVGALGWVVRSRRDYEAGRYTLVFVAPDHEQPTLELTHNWDQEGEYSVGRNFGHVAYSVPNIYDTCARLMERGVAISRPPRDGRMAFVRSPDAVSIELLQEGAPLPPAEPWASMPNRGEW